MHTITVSMTAADEEGDFAAAPLSESVSVAMDGEMDNASLREWILSCRQHSVAAEDWQTYHVIGDALRQLPVHTCTLSEKIRVQLQDEPTILAPQGKRTASKFLMPMAASVAAICLVGWSALNIPTANTHAPIMAAVPLQMAQVDQTKLVDQSKLANFIAAHRDFSSGANSSFMDAAYQVPAEPAR